MTLQSRGVNIVFVEPAFPPTQRHFVRALAEVGASVIGVGERPVEHLDDELKSWMTHYQQVSTVVDAGVLTDAVRWVQGKVWVDRIESTIEAHTMATAAAREACTIPGTSVRTAWLCRDKPSMKDVLRAAGIPTAASAAVTSAADVHAFVADIGFPVILKPRTGAGALDTVRVDDTGGLDEALGRFGGQGVESIAKKDGGAGLPQSPQRRGRARGD
jgi:D-alanine-D-alanine ligase-like ATP-grasp enzyme